VRLALPLMLLSGAGTGIVLLSLPATAGALPSDTTLCSGSLTSAPNAGLEEPYSLSYSFDCTNEISAYTIVVDRVSSDGDNLDDYDAAPAVIANGANPAPTAAQTPSVTCAGATPSNGINCYSLVGATAGPLGPGDTIQGSIDPTSAYCSHYPTAATPGTRAVPRAVVSVIVTDNTGAEDGPFELYLSKPCKAIPAVVPKAKTAKATAAQAKTNRVRAKQDR
jgi:hypothetical protein